MRCIKPSVFFAILFFASKLSANSFDTSQSKSPELLTQPLIVTTPDLLKRGLWGTSNVEIMIDSTGTVSSCNVVSSGNLAFDSLTKSKTMSARFSPAIENGKAVSSTAKFEISVPKDSLIEQCLRFRPNFTGTVIDSVQKTPVPKARILLHYTDTTEDNSIIIGFSRYLSMICNDTDQIYNGKLISTMTDSLGHFAFRLLPRGHFSVSIQSAGYETAKFGNHITDNKLLECQYYLKLSNKKANDSSFEITVYGKKNFENKKIIIAEAEKTTGFSSFLSNVLEAKPEIRHVPEGPSMMLVRSGCPYDNVYVISGVPMLSPFHFGGYPYADIDGLMISALPDVNVTINDIGGKRIDASGCIIEAQPSKIKYDDSTHKGLFLKGDINSFGLDLLTAYSSPKAKNDYLQLGYSFANSYLIKWNKYSYQSAIDGKQGIGIPLNYGNVTLSGSKLIGPFRYNAFGWFAWDSYNTTKGTATNSQTIRDTFTNFDKYDKKYFPWGMGSIKAQSTTSNRSITVGGAHQFFGTGKQLNKSVFSTRSYLNNGEIIADFDTIIRKPVVIKLTTRIDHDEWKGYLTKQDSSYLDTLSRAYGTETGLHLNSSLIKQFGHFTSALDLLVSAINYSGPTQLIGDAGASITYETNNYHAGIHIGQVTSRPDIRGLPDSHYRKQLNHTYITSLPFSFQFGIIKRFGIEPYIRYCTDAPQLDPVNKVWDPDKSTAFLAYGSDFDCHIVPTSWVELTTTLNLANAHRQGNSTDTLPYEWEIPWTVRTILHLHSRNDIFHFYVDFVRTKGLLYFDLDTKSYETLPVYRTIDLNFQICALARQHHHINNLDLYFKILNIQDLSGTANVRDYYWDSNNIRQPVFLGNGRLDIGARFGIKL